MAKASDGSATSLQISGEDADSAAAFSAANYDVSNRSKTAAVNWPNIPAWNNVGQPHQSPDLSSVVQQIVGRSGWMQGNAMAFIIAGSGVRSAISYDNNPSQAPALHIEFETGPTPTPTEAVTPGPSPTGTNTATPTATSTTTETPIDVAAYAVLASWVEAEVTWNDRNESAGLAWNTSGGDIDPTAATVASVVGKDIWVTWDVMTLVPAWLDGSSHGVLLNGAQDGVKREAKFASLDKGDSAIQPKLEVCYALSPSSLPAVERETQSHVQYLPVVVQQPKLCWLHKVGVID